MILRFPALVPVLLALCCVTAGHALAQGTNVAFGGLKADPSLPVEITADSLTFDNKAGTASFVGNVLIGQGEMRLSAGLVEVEYENADRRRIKTLHASGGVTLASGTDAAKAQTATYSVDSGIVVLSGDVVLTQGPSTMTGQTLTVNLRDGTGRMEGRVKTVLVPPAGSGGN